MFLFVIMRFLLSRADMTSALSLLFDRSVSYFGTAILCHLVVELHKCHAMHHIILCNR